MRFKVAWASDVSTSIWGCRVLNQVHGSMDSKGLSAWNLSSGSFLGNCARPPPSACLLSSHGFWPSLLWSLSLLLLLLSSHCGCQGFTERLKDLKQHPSLIRKSPVLQSSPTAWQPSRFRRTQTTKPQSPSLNPQP